MEYIGNLWKKQSENPKAPFASGVVKFMGRELRITVWDNSRRKREGKKDPDFSITLDEPRDQGKPPPAKPQPPCKPESEYASGTAGNDFTDDIPF